MSLFRKPNDIVHTAFTTCGTDLAKASSGRPSPWL